MILACDLGNTNTKMGIFGVGNQNAFADFPTDTIKRTAAWRKEFVERFEKSGIELSTLEGLAISSVVEESKANLIIKALQQKAANMKVVVVSHKTYPYNIKYQTPETLGADRLCDAAGAYKLIGSPLVVVDCGSAVTLSLVGKDGVFFGGAILPGPFMAAKALSEHTARIPFVETIFPKSVIGMTSGDSIRVGVTFGIVAAVEGLITRFQERRKQKLAVVITGGRGNDFARHSPMLRDYHPHLTLEGALEIYKSNTESA